MNFKKYFLSLVSVIVLVPSLSFAADQKDGAERKAEQAQQADQKQAANQANNDNSIPWKKVAANASAVAVGYFAGYICKKIGESFRASNHKADEFDLLLILPLLAAPFAYADHVDALWSLTGIALMGGSVL